jgi:hypothetical protein
MRDRRGPLGEAPAAPCRGDEEVAGLSERLIGLPHDVGSVSEEYHVPSRNLAGTAPQTLTHLGATTASLLSDLAQ